IHLIYPIYDYIVIDIFLLSFPLMLCFNLRSILFPYTTLFRSGLIIIDPLLTPATAQAALALYRKHVEDDNPVKAVVYTHSHVDRSEEHTSDLQSRFDLVCRLLLEKKKNQQL